MTAATNWRRSQLLLLLRPAQWTKNIFVLIPLLFSMKLTDTTALVAISGAFVVFCMGCQLRLHRQ